MEAAVSAVRARAGRAGAPERLRLLRVRSRDQAPGVRPALVTEVEGLVWYGARGEDGLAELIADERRSPRSARRGSSLDEALDEARATTGEGASEDDGDHERRDDRLPGGPRGDPDHRRDHGEHGRRQPAACGKPILRGALLALPASVLLWFVAQLVLDAFSQYGEKLEAVVGLIAIGVLLLVLNWFFHRVYWTEWIAGHRKRGKALAADVGAAGAAGAATVVGLYMLGFSSVFREGFETVLFLQALQLSSGTGVGPGRGRAWAWSPRPSSAP